MRQLYLGASSIEAYYCYFSSIRLITYAHFPDMYLFFAIICIDMTYVLAKLGWLALVFVPYVPVNSARA